MRQISEQERENRDRLFKLMAENPGLPVIPMVDGEVCGDDSGHWIGSLRTSRVDEYIISQRYYERVIFKSDDDVFDALDAYFSPEELDALPESVEECRPIYEALPWRKAIIVYIEEIEL